VRRAIIPSLAKWFFSTIGEWHARTRSRRELAAMSYADLKDLGYPAEAGAEKHKPFWRT
jgi:uncharacterized protein YjiS (DUF1127 family)